MIVIDSFLDFAIVMTLVILSLSLLLTTVRVVKGPTLSDRIVGLDMLVSVGMAFIAVIGVKTNYFLYIDIGIALGLVGFLSTVAFARFVLHNGDSSGLEIRHEEDAPNSEQAMEGEKG